MSRHKKSNYIPPTWVTFTIPHEDTDLDEWYKRNKGEGRNMSALIRETLRKGIVGEEAPQWFLTWVKGGGGQFQLGETSKVDLGGLFDD